MRALSEVTMEGFAHFTETLFWLPGRIIAITSDAVSNNIPYGATKAGLDRVVLASARELADRNIIADVINPETIDTGWLDKEIRQSCLER